MEKTTQEKIRLDILREDLKYKTDMIIKMYKCLEEYEKEKNQINELLHEYDTGKMTATMLVSNLKAIR